MIETESNFVKHTSCDSCGSSDANAIYSDGHTYCHKCHAVVPSNQTKGKSYMQQSHVQKAPIQGVINNVFSEGEILPIKNRGINQDLSRIHI